MLKNSIRSILYSLNENLNEGNANNSANLLVGSDVQVVTNNNRKKFLGTIELITNSEVIVKDNHTDDTYNFKLVGFNAHENAIEFADEDSGLKFFA